MTAEMEGRHAISRELAAVFAEAVCVYRGWNPTDGSRPITLDGRHYLIDEVCGLVDRFTDELPGDILHLLLPEVHDMPDGDLKLALQRDPTYSAAAHCLRSMMERRKQRSR